MRWLQGATAHTALAAAAVDLQMGLDAAMMRAGPRDPKGRQQPQGSRDMTSLATTPAVHAPFLRRQIAALVGRIAQERARRQTRRALLALTDRELNDLGLHRGMIETVAVRASRRG